MMKTTRFGLFALPALCLAGWTAARADLTAYVRRTEPEFSWSKKGSQEIGTVKIVDLQVRSQVWRGIPWNHTVRVFVPPVVRYPRLALLYITGGDPGPRDLVLASSIAPLLEAPVAILFNIPNQPLFDGKIEDDLIAHTFEEYLRTGDETWPLLFPMVKSAVRAMDALQEWSRRERDVPIEGFVVTGASKRGWTTYLTAAVDPRVRAIAPMVFDNLNFRAQLARQLELWGAYSEQIDDYSRRGLQAKMDTEAGRKLVSMVDPWFYRQRLTMPKLLIHGANDRYWATDAARLYWDDLPGDKYLLHVPNAGHGLEDSQRVLGTLIAFFHGVANGRGLPRLTFRYTEQGRAATLRLETSVEPREVRLWSARAPDLDFRPARWQASPMTRNGSGYEASAEAPATGGVAFFGEAEFAVDGRTFTLSTPPRVLGRRPERAARGR